MLRLPEFECLQPESLAAAVDAMNRLGEDALLLAGGTDLVPNMKHRLFEPKVIVSLERVSELFGITETDDGIEIGAMTRLADVAQSPIVQRVAPALAQATSLVAGPQLRTMGTLGGNVMLDTRCQWYNQTYFWRKSLGFCLKKDGTECHVVQGGQKCVAAASNDSAPALMSLGAELHFVGPAGKRSTPIDKLWKADGIYNKAVEHGEILTHIVVPKPGAGHRGAYGKLRDRGSIDFPLFGVAVRIDCDSDGRVTDADVVTVALAARPLRIRKVAETLAGHAVGSPEFEAAVEAVAEQAFKQCHPLPNVPGDHDYRREMVPVYVRRTLRAAAEQAGPVHHI